VSFLSSGTTKTNGELMTIRQEMQVTSIAFQYLLRDENVHVNGIVLIFDMTGFGTKQMSRFTSGDVRKWHSHWKVSNISTLQSTSSHRMSYKSISQSIINQSVIISVAKIAESITKSTVAQLEDDARK